MIACPLLAGAAPDVAVVIPTYRRAALLQRCLQAVCAQRLPGRRFEVVVVDDGRDEDTRVQVLAYAAQEGRAAIRYLRPGIGKGPAAARNAGWRSSAAPVIAFTDDDTIPAVDWLAEGLGAMAEGVDALAGAIRVPIPNPCTDHQWNTYGLEKAEFATANAFVRRDALERVGGFDERFTRAWREDSDLQFSLLEAGCRIARCPRAVVVHPVRPERWGVSLRQQRNAMFEALLYKKHPDLYRARIRGRPPLARYGLVVTALAAPVLVLAGHLTAALACALVTAGGIGRIAAARLHHTDRSARHVTEMVVTSCAIPFLSVYWRVRGSLQHRIFFL